MKRIGLFLLLGTLGAMSTFASNISMAVGFGGALNQGILVSSVLTDGTDTSITFSGGSPVSFTLTACDNLALCGAPVSAASAVFTSGVLETFSFAGMTYETSGPWVVSVSGSPGNLTFSLNTTGVYKAAGFSDTGGSLNFSFQQPAAGDIYTFSASGGTVPEPASIALMTSGLAGLALLARRRRKQ